MAHVVWMDQFAKPTFVRRVSYFTQFRNLQKHYFLGGRLQRWLTVGRWQSGPFVAA